MQIDVGGISVKVEKKNIKNMHLYVKPPDGHVVASVPIKLSDESIALFIRTKLGWIKKQQEKFEHQERQTERQFVSGETLYVLGKQYYLHVNYSGKGNSLVLNGDNAILTVRKESTPKQRENWVSEWYRDTLKNQVNTLLPKWEKKTGLIINSWQSRYMTTRWGSCNYEKKKIILNLQLAKKPIECIEYVILHELIHLKVPNHGNDFLKLMDEYMPYWRETRKKLNDSKLDYFPISDSIETD